MNNSNCTDRIYELYVGTAEAVSERRGKTNSFFLATNSTLVTADSVLLVVLDSGGSAALVAAAGLILCVAWNRLLQSYRELNSAKFQVIAALEKNLPAAPFSSEWRILTEGGGLKEYVGLSRVESRVPWVFGVLYAVVIGIYCSRLVSWA